MPLAYLPCPNLRYDVSVHNNSALRATDGTSALVGFGFDEPIASELERRDHVILIAWQFSELLAVEIDAPAMFDVAVTDEEREVLRLRLRSHEGEIESSPFGRLGKLGPLALVGAAKVVEVFRYGELDGGDFQYGRLCGDQRAGSDRSTDRVRTSESHRQIPQSIS